MTPEEFLWAQIDTSGGPTSCWPWRGTLNDKGYGRPQIDGKLQYAHRVAYETRVGPIPTGLKLLHSCDNPPCCNPAHLRPGTQRENVQDMVDRARAARRCGEANGSNVKLSKDKVRAIRSKYAAGGVSYRALAREFGVDKSLIGLVVRREAWSHI